MNNNRRYFKTVYFFFRRKSGFTIQLSPSFRKKIFMKCQALFCVKKKITNLSPDDVYGMEHIMCFSLTLKHTGQWIRTGCVAVVQASNSERIGF